MIAITIVLHSIFDADVFLAGSQPDKFSFVPEVLTASSARKWKIDHVKGHGYRLPEKIDRLP
jgi:hypothetical protein